MTANSTHTSSGSARARLEDDLAIRFVNTAAWRLRTPFEERLPNADALLDWLAANDLASRESLSALSRAWRRDPQRSQSVYAAAMRLREAIYEVLIARMAGRAPLPAALDVLNGLLGRAAQGAEVKWRSGDLVWCVRPDDDPALLRPIIVSAVDLVTGPRRKRVKQCQDDRGCGWLFVDESRAQNRRWCSMGDCGNRAKAHRHYLRARRDDRF